MPVRLTILGSGSSGNCAYVETDETRVLIDAGFSLRQIRQRLATIGRVPENLTGILVTHEHSDHVQSLPLMSEKLHIPIYCNRPTQEAVEYQSKRGLPVGSLKRARALRWATSWWRRLRSRTTPRTRSGSCSAPAPGTSVS